MRKNIGETRSQITFTDSGFRGKIEVGGTQILLPQNRKESSRYKQEVARKRFRARAAIEPHNITFKKKPRFRIKLPQRRGCLYS